MALPGHVGTFLLPADIGQVAATNQLITPTVQVMPVVDASATPWYKTPIGIGAIAVGALLAFRHFRKGK